MSPRYVSISTLSELTGKDRRTIVKRLENLEFREEGRAKLYDAQEALPILYKSETTSSIDKQLMEEQLRYERARADKVELEVAKRKGELIEVEQVAGIVAQEYTAVKAAMLALPNKQAHALAILHQPAEIKKHLEDAVNEVLVELSADVKFTEEFPTEELNDYDESSEETIADSLRDTEASSEVEPS